MAVETDETTPAPTGRGPRTWLGRWLAVHDPGLRAAKRSLRAAVIVPSAFAIADYGIGHVQSALFASFGAVAMCIFADFGGNRMDRLRAYLALVTAGCVFIVIGTACSTHPVLAVTSMAVVGFGVLYVGVFSPQAALGATAALLSFVLPVTVAAPPSVIGYRLAGWGLAAAFSVPACVFVFTGRFHDQLRRRIAEAAGALGELVAAHGEGHPERAARDRVLAVLAALRAQYEATPYRPTGAGPDDVAVTMLVARLEWVAANAVVDESGLGHQALADPQVRSVNQAVARVLVGIEAVEGHAAAGRSRAAEQAAQDLQQAVAELVRRRQSVSDTALDVLLADRTPLPDHGPDGDSLVSSLDPTFDARVLAIAVQMAASDALRSLGPRSVAARFDATVETWRRRADVGTSELRPTSVWLRNSLRGAIGLAAAVAVVEATDVQHGFWVVLGTLSVLRTNAVGTGANVVRALTGVIAGFVIGAAILVGLGGHSDLLWAVLPIAVALAGFAPAAISFAAGQAAFTVLVVVLFNLLAPTGWKVGLLRVEDVAIGCAVSLAVGFLFWPRGAGAALGAAFGRSFATSATAVRTALERVTGAPDDGEAEASLVGAAHAEQGLDDAYRQYLSERGSKPAPLESVTRLLTCAGRIRLLAETLQAVGPAPADGLPPANSGLQRAAAALIDACSAQEHWYQELGTALAEHRVPEPLPPATGDLAPLVRAAVEEARQSGERPEMTRAVRLLWADRGLEHLCQIERSVTQAAERYVGTAPSGSGDR